MEADTAVWHVFKNIFLLALSFLFLPIDTLAIGLISLRNWVRNESKLEQQDVLSMPMGRKTILITGVSMATGLALARLFHRRGHRVIAADFHTFSIGFVSKAIDKLYWLPAPSASVDVLPLEEQNDPYALRLLHIVNREAVDLWVSVSDVNAAFQDAQARDLIEGCTRTKCVQLSTQHVMMLHEKASFINYAKGVGLPVPDTYVITNRTAAIDQLRKKHGLYRVLDQRQYLLKPIGVNDVARHSMPLLPLATEQQTLSSIEATMPANDSDPFILQEFIEGDEYCTHALVIRGQVRAFAACPSERLLQYHALPSESPLSRLMLGFTQRLAATGGSDFTGHVSFDFIVKHEPEDDDEDKTSVGVQIYALECNPRVHTAVVLFNNTPELVDEYLEAIFRPNPSKRQTKLITPTHPQKYYWLGQDLVEKVIYPLYQAAVLETLTTAEVLASWTGFVEHIRSWKDGTFEEWDPWPWWWLYHVYWPANFLQYIFHGRWSKVNCSTGKAFKAE